MIFALLAILCLHALGVHASLTCNNDQPSAGPSDAKLNGLLNTVKGSVAQLCHTRQVGTLSHVHEDTVFTVERGTTLYGDDCVQSFSTIVTQCKVGGGVITDADKGIKYMVSVKEKTSKRDEGGLEARAKKGNKPSKPKSTEEAKTKASEETKPKSTEETKPKTTEESKPKSSEGTKPTPTEKSKSTEDIKSKSTKDSTPPPTAATAKPTSQVPTSKPAPKPTTPSVSHSKSVSPTPSRKSPSPTPTPTPSRDCKKVYNKLVAESNKYELNERSLSGLVSRDGYSGSRVHIEKRYRTKKGTACGTYLLYAHEYPSPNEMVSRPATFSESC
jgi:chemotaxis protein histidine kinase CheA